MFFKELRSGQSVEKNEIKALLSDHSGKKYFYLLAGVHGDEVEGVYVLDKILQWLKTDIAPQLPMVVVPILNVDGYRDGSRVNANGVDLNRNLDTSTWTSEARDDKYFPGKKALSEPENIFLDKLFKKFPPGFILSLHSWKRFINTNGDCLKQAKLMQKFNNYEIVDGDIQDHPTPGSLGHYATEKYNCPIITFELPTITDEEISLQEIWLESEVSFKELIKTIEV